MIVAVLQARSSSSRLPRKVLRPILGRPMLTRQIERLKRCRGFDRLVIATSIDPSDDAIEVLAQECGVGISRGSLDDVLDRMYRAAQPYGPTHIVRLTGDCPLADPEVVDRVIAFAREGGYDYASNTLKPTWPDGIDVEVATFAAFETAWREATSPVEREHVMPFIYNRPERFSLGNLENDQDLSGFRWTVDEAVDFAFVERIYEALYPAQPAFTTADILAYLARNPAVLDLNASIERNEGYKRALENFAKGTA